MALRSRSTTRLPLLRLVLVLVLASLCAFLPLPHLGVLTLAESDEAKCPCQEGRESSEEGPFVWPSPHRHLNYRCLNRSHKTVDRLHQIASYSGHLSAIVGHQLANGFRAPLLL